MRDTAQVFQLLLAGIVNTDKMVKDCLCLVTIEQFQAPVTPKQATPFFMDKLTHFSKYLEGELTKLDRFITARDQAYSKLAFFNGDHPRDLGQIKVAEILRFPNDDGRGRHLVKNEFIFYQPNL